MSEEIVIEEKKEVIEEKKEIIEEKGMGDEVSHDECWRTCHKELFDVLTKLSKHIIERKFNEKEIKELEKLKESKQFMELMRSINSTCPECIKKSFSHDKISTVRYLFELLILRDDADVLSN